MSSFDRLEVIQSLLENMVSTAQVRTYISKYWNLVAPGELEPLKRRAEKSEEQYKEFFTLLGGIPVRLNLDEEETEVQITTLDKFDGGQWHYRYQANGDGTDKVGSGTPQDLMYAFWESIRHSVEESQSE